jgi:hypothetical protein
MLLALELFVPFHGSSSRASCTSHHKPFGGALGLERRIPRIWRSGSFCPLGRRFLSDGGGVPSGALIKGNATFL